jgi:fibronectin-binding autotransporter adhesin
MAVNNILRRQSYTRDGSGLYGIFPEPLLMQTSPGTTDKALVGQVWINEALNAVFTLTSISGGEYIWTPSGGGAGTFTSLTVTPGPISLTGTTTINTSGAAATSIGTGGTGAVNIGNTTGHTTVTGLLTTGALTTVGAVSMNASGAATTTIGTGGTGAVNIGNATGNTSITGVLTVSTNIFTTNGSISAGTTTASAASNNIQFLKSRTGGVITTGDTLGNIIFAGYDGTQYTTGASISAVSNGTIASTRVAASLQFSTHPDSAAASPTLRASISSAGNVVIAAPDSGVGLTVSGGGAAVTVGNLTVLDGNVVLGTAATMLTLPGPVNIMTGAGAPASGLAVNVGDMYINTGASTTTTRLYIATGAGAWTYFTSNA